MAAGEDYRVRAECGSFGRIRNYMEFCFCFLLVFFRIVIKDRYLCDGCAGGLFRRMLFRNLPSARLDGLDTTKLHDDVNGVLAPVTE